MIVGISGSLREDSHTAKAVRLALKQVENAGWKTTLIDLRTLNLPFCDGSKDYPDYPDVAKLRSIVKSAKGLIIATPEYHGSISGGLKNALDLLETSQLEHKIVAIIVVLGGGLSQGTVNAVGHICRYLNAWILPLDLIIPNSYQAFDSQNRLINEPLQKRLDDLIEYLLFSVKKLSLDK